MFKKIHLFAVLSSFSLAGCGGMLAYEDGGTVSLGNLDEQNLNVMKSTGSLSSVVSPYDNIVYGIDRGGKFVGICRTDIPPYSSPRNNSTQILTDSGDFTVYTLRTETGSLSQIQLMDQVDQFQNTSSYSASLDDSWNCFEVGSSPQAGRLVIYLQYQDGQAQPLVKELAVLLDVTGATPSVVDVETFQYESGGRPQRVVAQTNPLRGNTVEIVNGEIRINGQPVTLATDPSPTPMPIGADSVDHHFE